MKALPPTLIVGLMLAAGPRMYGQAADLLELSSLIGNYNLISFGTANLSLINNEAQGPIASGGNLSVGGDPLVTISSFDNSPNPDLYVQGTFSIANNGVVQLNNGFASLPGNAGTGTYPLGGNNTRYQPAGTTGWLQVNSSVTDSNTDPRTNPTGVWSGSTMSTDQSSLTQVSQDLAGDAANGTIGVSGQNLVFTGAASGVSIFNLNANNLTQSGGSTFYNGQRVSSISFNIPANALYVVNLQNGNGRTIFGQGFNFNALTGNQASQLLWNVEPSAGNGTTTVTLGNGGEFYGSVLAPQVNLLNGLNTPINGQVVADTITYDNAELEFTAFDPQAAIPEPGTYALALGTAVLAFAAWKPRPVAAACAADGRMLPFGFWGSNVESKTGAITAAEPRPEKARIHLSPPHVGAEERRYVEEAFEGNWIAPAGPHLAAFEEEMCAASGAAAAACLSSGTGALHLAVRLAGVRPGDEVLCSTFTFAASAGPIVYEGGRPVFIDAERRSWNMDPGLLAEALAQRARQGRLPRAIVVTDIYGQCASWDEICEAAAAYGVPVIEDAAEAVGATYRGKWAGRFGLLGVFSFNGNKIMTTSGGGMLVSSDAALIERAKKLATQARDPAPHYEHSELGFNYRMSNVLAGIGRGQLKSLPQRIHRRRQIFDHYRRALGDLAGVGFMPELPEGRGNRWLTCLTIDPALSEIRPAAVLAALAADDIEARPLWKPLHRQPLYAAAESIGGSVADELFSRGICLPSGSAMTEDDLNRVVAVIRGAFGAV